MLVSDDSLIRTKDELLCILNDADDAGEFLTAAETVLERLEGLFNVFCGNSYAYKGREICGRIDRSLWDYSAETSNHRRLSRIARLRDTATGLEQRFHTEEGKRLFPAA